MSQENVEIVREAYRVLAKGVDERAASSLVEAGLADPDGEIDFRTAYPDGQVLRLAGMTEFFDTQPWGRSLRFEAESIKAAGTDRVLVFVRVRGVGSGSGVEIEGRLAHLITIRENRLARTEVYTDRDKALKAAGLGE
jgi:ketosteroid isomerase-like protein